MKNLYLNKNRNQLYINEINFLMFDGREVNIDIEYHKSKARYYLSQEETDQLIKFLLNNYKFEENENE